MTNPNDMSTWADIACQRGHDTHAMRQVHVKLGGPTAYADLAPIPQRFAREFDLLVWDPDVHPVDGGPYCPAADAVSTTIATLGVWEPQETTLTLQVCSSAGPRQHFVDFGAQIGWFSMLALSCGLTAMAIEADADCRRLIAESAALNGWGQRLDERGHHRDHVEIMAERIGPDTPAWGNEFPIRLAKIDIEGAEDEAVRVLWPSIEAGLVDHLLIEISPVFADYYPDLVVSLLDAGYTAYLLPAKQIPPAPLTVFPDDLEPGRLDRASAHETVAGWHQANVWFARDGASW